MATFLPGQQVYKPIEFATPCTNYRRNLAAALATVEVGNDVEYSTPTSNYRRNLAAASPGFEISHDVHLVTGFTNLPKVRGLYLPSILIDVVAGPYLAGDSGIEVVYNIPNKLRIRPHLLAPPNGSQHRLGSPVMIWTETVEAVYYEVHVALDIEFRYRVARLDVLGGQVQHGWPFGGTYYWRVRAVAGSAWSDYSEVWRFTVPSLTPMAVAGHDAEGRDRLLNQFKAGT